MPGMQLTKKIMNFKKYLFEFAGTIVSQASRVDTKYAVL